ncbi:MAG: ABC transporter permease subunit [Okeania sp. SIO3I5]|uniref:GXWXG domain-containing protein n=1 Tax=Okeania sp. SIO3I5 TaxID=2607805 RepID=UPI0013B5E416|nr:GXWXG domain-containing protein [Okeania sp. SIO3I5]NEQ38421.1 ABC transporter permease subunit [Okeania sp. SIO3I5]
MNTLEKLNTTLENGRASTEEALKFFDELESVNLEFLIGRWQGYEFPTNHPMDGLLEASGWYGKEFVDAEQVHPLLFLDGNNNIFKVDPNPIAMNLGLSSPVFKSKTMKPVFQLMNLMLKILGIIAGIKPFISRAIRPLISALQGVPPIAWIVIALLWFGTGNSTAIFTVAVATLPIIFIGAVEGVRNINSQLLEMANTFKIPIKIY